MNNTPLSFLVTILLITFSLQLYGQGDCEQTISHASDEFNAGHFYSIPGILKECLDHGNLSTDQEIRAYMMLCQAYLIIDDHIAAEDSYLKLLKADPEFIPNERDHPIDVVYLSKKFTAIPVFTPHFRLGTNTSFLHTIFSNSTQPYPTTTNYNFRLGFQAGAGIDWNVTDQLSVCGEADFALKGFKRVTTGIAGGDAQSITSNQWWLDVPFYLKYTYHWKSQMRLFGYAGYSLGYLLSARNDFLYTDNKIAVQNGQQTVVAQIVAEGPSQQVTYQSTSLNHSLVFGVGLKYKIGHDFIYADLRYMAGLNNTTRADQMYYANPSTIDPKQIGNPDYYLSSNVTKYRYVNDYMRIDNLSLSFGYVHPIYNPRRVKKANTKGVAKQIQKGGKKK